MKTNINIGYTLVFNQPLAMFNDKKTFKKTSNSWDSDVYDRNLVAIELQSLLFGAGFYAPYEMSKCRWGV